MAKQKAPIQKAYEINIRTDSIYIDFLRANRQLDWLELSLVYDKSDKHTTIYDVVTNRQQKNKICKII